MQLRKKTCQKRERERERRCFTYIFYAFQHVKLWSANQKGRDTFLAIKKAPSGFFCCFFLSRLHSCLAFLSILK